MHHMLDLGLSDREKYFIAEIISQWGALEHEVFHQTLLTFEPGDALPREMNNLQFSGVLKLWKERVVDPASAKRIKALRDVHSGIAANQDARNALVHGMWGWEPSAPGRIFVTRVKRDQVIKTTFTADALQALALVISGLYFKLKYPRGLAELAQERARLGYSVSRRWIEMVSDDEAAGELLNFEKK